jgi:sec-independent protein translocase protein TatA
MYLINFFLAIGPWQVVLVAVVILLLFGGKKIPELMKGLGSGIKEFKKGVKEEEEEENPLTKKKSTKLED